MKIPCLIRAGVLTLTFVLVIAPAGTMAQDRDIILPSKAAAELAATAAQVPALRESVAGLEAARATDKQVITGLCQLMDIKDQLIAGHRSLLALAYEAEARRTEQVAETRHDAAKETRKAGVIAGASAGAAIGTAAFPGVGTLVGLGVGAAVGYFSTPAPEPLAEHVKPRDLPKLETQAPPKVCLPVALPAPAVP